MSEILNRALELHDDMRAYRRHIHRNAECGMDLPNTTAYVKAKLEEIGLEVKEICKSGLVAVIEGEHDGKTIMLRADMDALPMNEENDLSLRARLMHLIIVVMTCIQPCFLAQLGFLQRENLRFMEELN